jgi:aspartate racemase
MKKQRVVGVLGGLGPEATLDFFAKVLKRTGARSDQEHLHLIIDNNPWVPNRNDAVAGRGPSPGPYLAEMARSLERSGADFLVMVCNTAHAFAGDIVTAVEIPFVNMIALTRDETLARYPLAKTVGMLAASGCLEAGLYQKAFAERNVSVLTLEDEEQAHFMTLLYRIKSGDAGDEVRAEVRALANRLVERSAEVVVAGCTEVPLVLGEGELSRPLVNSTDVLVEKTIAYARHVEEPA